MGKHKAKPRRTPIRWKLAQINNWLLFFSPTPVAKIYKTLRSFVARFR